jgi:hypothetical protein
MTGLDYPAACPPVGVALLEVDLLATCADVWCELVVFE